jgi:hypothetical protein
MKCLSLRFGLIIHVGETVDVVMIGEYCDDPENMRRLSNAA